MTEARSEAPPSASGRPQVQQEQGQSSMDAFLRQVNLCQHWRQDVGEGGRPTGRCFWHWDALGESYEVQCDGVVEGKCDLEPRQEAA